MKYSAKIENITAKERNSFSSIYIPIDACPPLSSLEKYPSETKIIFEISSTKEDLWKIKEIQKIHPNIEIAFPYFFLEVLEKNFFDLEKIKEIKISYSFTTPAFTFSELEKFIELGVSRVIISGDILCFNLNKTKNICSKNEVEMIGFGGYCEKESLFEGNVKPDTRYNFFIRPDDIYIYEQYFDEIFFPKMEQENSADTLLRIYQNNTWPGDLKPLIKNLQESIFNNHIPPYFSEIRANCGKRCKLGTDCSVCPNIFSLSEALKEKGLEIRIVKEKENH